MSSATARQRDSDIDSSAPSRQYDALIIGGSYDGLVCAAYMAMAGLKVCVLERSSNVGGQLATKEFHPGFRNSVAAHPIALLNQAIVRDLQLTRHGLRMNHRPLAGFLPTSDDKYLKVGLGTSAAQLGKFSLKDATRLPAYGKNLRDIANLLDLLLRSAGPESTQGSWRTALPDMFRASKQNGLLRDDSRLWRELHRLFDESAGDYLDRWFQSDPIKSFLGFNAIQESFQSPYAPGTGHLLLHHVFAERDARANCWGHAAGGMGAISSAVADAALRLGAHIRHKSSVRELIWDQGRVAGVVTEGGFALRAPVVISCISQRALFKHLIGPEHVSISSMRQVVKPLSHSGMFRINVALKELPDFKCLPGNGVDEHHGARIILAPSLAHMEQAYFEARTSGWSRRPIIELVIPSALDESLAPAGQHVAGLFCHHVEPWLPSGSSWNPQCEHVADQMIAAVDEYAPNFAAAVVGRKILEPVELECTGDIIPGNSREQMAARPLLGYGNLRSPLRGLHLCGSGSHPGGGITGAPGYNAAQAVIRDLRCKSAKSTA